MCGAVCARVVLLCVGERANNARRFALQCAAKPLTSGVARLASVLESAVNGAAPKKVVIFAASHAAADELTRSLRIAAWPSLMFSGEPSERDWVISEFRSNTAPIMVLTDQTLAAGPEPGQ